MKKMNVIITAIVSTITIMLTISFIYPTRTELDARVKGVDKRIDDYKGRLIRLEDKADNILEILRRDYGRNKRNKRGN